MKLTCLQETCMHRKVSTSCALKITLEVGASGFADSFFVQPVSTGRLDWHNCLYSSCGCHFLVADRAHLHYDTKCC